MQSITDAQGNVVGVRDKYSFNRIHYHGDSKVIKIKASDADRLRFCWFEWIDETTKDTRSVMISDILKADVKEKGNYIYNIG